MSILALVSTDAFLRFASRTAEPRTMVVLRWIILPLLCVHVVLATISGYRAIHQIYRLDLRVPNAQLTSGSRLGLYVVTSGRVEAGTILELRQGARVETLAIGCVPRNGNGSYDPRARRDSIFATLGADILWKLASGSATLRATATGSPQWLRTPPPTVREAPVNLVVDPATAPSRSSGARHVYC
jgi:hypothetical protein